MSGRPTVAPPKPRPKPGHVDVVRALYNYAAQHTDELSFEEGDTLYIIDKNAEKGWWKGRCGDQIGLIPINYIESSTETIDHPLHEAAKRGNVGFLQECLANKIPNVEINAQNKLGDTALHNAAWKNHPEIVQILLERGAITDLQNKENKTAFNLARDPEVGKLLQVRTTVRDDEYGLDADSD